MNPISEDKLNKWRNLINEKKQSGLSLTEFCKEKNISAAQYYYYHAIINRPNKEIKHKDFRNTNLKPIQILNPKNENVDIRFILPNSMQCVLPRDMTAQEIKNILEIVMSC
ncbi:MAG: IS66 family insertion sequence element accessory protein TnpA [Gammaproteobacteria bacterium]